MLIRKSLYKKMLQKSDKPFKKILDLSYRPQEFNNHFISISHTRKIGGYFITPNTPIGFDIEERARCKNHLYKKILSHPKETGIEISKLWTLKEASLKAFGFLSEKISLKDILIQQDPSCSKNYHIMYKNLTAQGLSLKTSFFTIALVKVIK
ncbi:MAG: hypothetical protein ACR2M7_02160 [Bdellovibrionales bacterium]